MWLLATAHLLGFEVFVEEIQGFFVCLCASHDSEHAFAGIIVRSLRDRDTSTRASSDFADFGSTTANDTANHVRGDADVLCLNFLAIFSDKWDAAVLSVGVRASAIAAWVVAEVGAVSGTVIGAAAVTTAGIVVAARSDERAGHWCITTNGGTDGGVVEDGSSTTLPIINEALSNLPNGLFDSFGSSLDFDDSLSGLWKHLLLCNHSNTGSVLDVFDFQTLASDDGTHLIMRYEKADS